MASLFKNRWDTFKRVAAYRRFENPPRNIQRIYDTLDKLRLDYTRHYEFCDDIRYYFPPAVITHQGKIAVINARGRHEGGWEDKHQRIAADRMTEAMRLQHIPFLYGRNNWDINVWELQIRKFLLRLAQEECPQVIGPVVKKYTKKMNSRTLRYD